MMHRTNRYLTRHLSNSVCIFVIGFFCVNSLVYAQTLEEQAQQKIATLKAMESTAESKGLAVEREKMTLRTADLFLRYANWDESHISANEDYFNQLPNFKADANSLARALPDFERKEVVKILDDAIERLGFILDGTYTRKYVPKVDYAKARLLGPSIIQDGRPVFLADHIWKPEHAELQEFYGALGSGYISPSHVINENGDIKPSLSSELDNKASGNIGYVFLDHNNMPGWAKKKYDNFGAGSRHYGHYDVDHPGARELYGFLFKGTIPKMAGKNYRHLGYMLFNEPSFPTAAGTWNTGGVSAYTKAKLKTWLSKKHATIDDLNKLWETDFNSFDNVTITIPINTEKQGTPMWYDWAAFNNDRITDWFRFLVNEIRKYDSDARFHIKLMPWLWTGDKKDHGMDFESLTRLCNISGCDASAKNSNIWNKHEKWMNRYAFDWVNISMMFDFFKSVESDQIIVDSETHFLSSVHFRDLYLKPGYVRATYWLAHMHGLCVSENWFWARGASGEARRAGGGYAGSNNQQPIVLNEMHATYIDLNTFAEEITAMQRLRKPLRIYYSLANAINRKSYIEDVYANYESVYFEGVPLGFATAGIINEEDPSDWDAILIWKTETVTLQEFNVMQEYLDQGGTVIMDAESFQKDEYGRAHGQLRRGRGNIHIVRSLGDMKHKALALVANRGGLPEVNVTQTNGVEAKGCVWRCIQNRDGNYVLSIVNISKSEARLQIELKNAKNGTICKDLLTGVIVNSRPKLKPFDVFFVEVTSTFRKSRN
jgi:hypothetical protein